MNIWNKIILRWHAYHFRKSIVGVYVAKEWCNRRGLYGAAAALDQAAHQMAVEYTRMKRSA